MQTLAPSSSPALGKKRKAADIEDDDEFMVDEAVAIVPDVSEVPWVYFMSTDNEQNRYSFTAFVSPIRTNDSFTIEVKQGNTIQIVSEWSPTFTQLFRYSFRRRGSNLPQTLPPSLISSSLAPNPIF
jgi:hypothetical protein